MFVRLSAAIAALSLLGSAALAQGAKPTDPQIAHVAYTAGVIDITAARQAISKASKSDSRQPNRLTAISAANDRDAATPNIFSD